MHVLDIIAGARPNFMKVAAVFAVADRFSDLSIRLVHTGQHYGEAMSDVFFHELGLPAPVCHLGVGSGSHATQTARIMERYGSWIENHRPEMCIVVGDVNSTLACSLVAAKEHIPVAHIEAGLRSFDRMMPEELNRVLTDAIADLLFVTEESGIQNLMAEGRAVESIHMVGHVMIDTLLRMLPRARALEVHYRRFGFQPQSYAYVTLHRPSNVDDFTRLAEICRQLDWVGEQMPVVFSVHPRTRPRLGLVSSDPQFFSSIKLVEPLSYLDSLCMVANAKLVITDSGGLQEETSVLNVPCLTLRDSSERPVTITHGTNTVIGGDWQLFRDRVTEIRSNARSDHECRPIPLWDGHAAERILAICGHALESRTLRSSTVTGALGAPIRSGGTVPVV